MQEQVGFRTKEAWIVQHSMKLYFGELMKILCMKIYFPKVTIRDGGHNYNYR